MSNTLYQGWASERCERRSGKGWAPAQSIWDLEIGERGIDFRTVDCRRQLLECGLADRFYGTACGGEIAVAHAGRGQNAEATYFQIE